MPAESSALLTDLYQLTMLQAYREHRMGETAVFEFSVRALPSHRGFLVSAGLEQALAYLATVHFRSEELEWLAKDGRFRPDFVRYFVSATLLDFGAALGEGRLTSTLVDTLGFRFAQYWGSYRGNHEHRKLSRARKEHYFYPRGHTTKDPQSDTGASE